MGDVEHDDSMRMLVRHQWVREHGTPRVTTLVGPPEQGKRLWHEWVQLCGRPAGSRGLFDRPTRAGPAWLDRVAAKAAALAEATPRAPVAVVVDATLLDRWLSSRDDRLGAFIREGLVQVARGSTARRHARPTDRATPRPTSMRLLHTRARSLAELTLFEALEATASTAGRFLLNQTVSFHFGSRAAEIDLLSRADELAIEVDGFHHFQDPERYRLDRHKDLLLQANGYVVIRFLANDILADPRQAVRMVVELLGRQRGRERLRRRP